MEEKFRGAAPVERLGHAACFQGRVAQRRVRHDALRARDFLLEFIQSLGLVHFQPAALPSPWVVRLVLPPFAGGRRQSFLALRRLPGAVPSGHVIRS